MQLLPGPTQAHCLSLLTTIGKTLLPILVLCLGWTTSPAHGDIVKTGEDEVPGHPGQFVEWRAAHSKTPYGNPVGKKDIHFWFDLELKNPAPGDDIRFVVCAMLNINKTRINMPAFQADLNAGEWQCVPDGTVNWYPNYHFGCKRIRLHQGNNWSTNAYDERVEFSVEFTESEIAAPYIDFAIDCPSGFTGCGGLFGAQDQFLTPGDGNFPGVPDGTSSWWIYTGEPFTVDPLTFEGLFHIGNWYTMRFPEQTYESVLEGVVTNAPIGARLEFEFPLSAEACQPIVFLQKGTAKEERCIRRFTVTEDPFPVEIPLVITEALASEEDEHIHFRVSFPPESTPPQQGDVIEFLGQVTATNLTTFPDGQPLFEPGDFMHGVQVQFPVEDDLPFVVDQRLRSLPGNSFELSVTAADRSTMAIAASAIASVGDQDLEIPLEFDVPAAVGERTRFRATIGPLPSGQQVNRYEIRLEDDAGNVSTTSFGVFSDCNSNAVDDAEDIANGTSQDVNANGQPDECELGAATWRFRGTAAGGAVSVTLAGFSDTCTVSISTTSGQSTDAVVGDLASALNADACMSSQGFVATASDDSLRISGFLLTHVDTTVTDPGLQHEVPILSIPVLNTVGILAMVLLLMLGGWAIVRSRF